MLARSALFGTLTAVAIALHGCAGGGDAAATTTAATTSAAALQCDNITKQVPPQNSSQMTQMKSLPFDKTPATVALSSTTSEACNGCANFTESAQPVIDKNAGGIMEKLVKALMNHFAVTLNTCMGSLKLTASIHTQLKFGIGKANTSEVCSPSLKIGPIDVPKVSGLTVEADVTVIGVKKADCSSILKKIFSFAPLDLNITIKASKKLSLMSNSSMSRSSATLVV